MMHLHPCAWGRLRQPLVAVALAHLTAQPTQQLTDCIRRDLWTTRWLFMWLSPT